MLTTAVWTSDCLTLVIIGLPFEVQDDDGHFAEL